MKIYVTDCDHADMNIEKKIFEEAGLSFEHCKAVTEDEVIRSCPDGEIFLVQYAHITEKVMENIPSLKLIVRYGVGVDTVDLEAAARHGIQVCNVPDYGMNEVADQAAAMLLALKRKLTVMNRYTREEKWDYTKAITIHRFSEQTVGIVGLGRIGRCFASRVHAFGFRILGYDPVYKEIPGMDYIQMTDFGTLLEESDAISVHCPADGNRNLFAEEQFRRMKKEAVIINVSRGGIINERALDQALREGRIAGAGLDCLEKEPMEAGNPLLRHENLIVTPHMAWYSEEAAKELKRKVAEEAVRFVKGEAVRYPVNQAGRKK